jgi:hypothetical protein
MPEANMALPENGLEAVLAWISEGAELLTY